MASARCTSTPSRVSGPCCAPGSARIAVSRRKSCRTTSASSNMCTTHAVAAKPCSARSSPPWSYDPAQHPGSQQEPTAKGTPKWWDVQVAPIPGSDGRPAKLLSNSRDITEEHRATTALILSEARHRAILESSTDYAIVASDH